MKYEYDHISDQNPTKLLRRLEKPQYGGYEVINISTGKDTGEFYVKHYAWLRKEATNES